MYQAFLGRSLASRKLDEIWRAVPDGTKIVRIPAQTVLGYDAYFDTYTIDERAGVITHRLESALFPGDIGKSITSVPRSHPCSAVDYWERAVSAAG